MSSHTQPNKRRLRYYLKVFTFMTLGGVFCAILLFLYLWFTTPTYPSFESYKQAYNPSDIKLLDRNGKPLHRLRVNFQNRKGDWISLENISPALTKALLVTEDKRFYTHSGVDIQAIVSAILNNISQDKQRGASTVSMQFVGLIDSRIAPSGKRTLWQKMQQAVAAIAFERSWTKEQILEAYFNSIAFRGENVGIAAATEHFLKKHPNGLDEKEAAMLVALIRSPNAPTNTVIIRACNILEQMQAMNAQAECKNLEHLLPIYFSRPSPSPSQGIAPHLAQQLLTMSKLQGIDLPSTLYTTLDATIQQKALNSLQQHLKENTHRQIEDGAVIVLDNRTGHVLAWVGSSGEELSQANEVDAVMALRQPGSTLKPFLYAQAIEERRLTAASLIHDSPLSLNIGGALYIPQNYDRKYKGWVSVRTALGSSLNIPAVRTIVMLGVNSFANTLRSIGLPLEKSPEFYGYSLALGSAEVNLLSLTNAYRSLANAGQTSEVKWIDEIRNHPFFYPSAHHLKPYPSSISPQTAWIIGSILSDKNARISTFGIDNILNTRFWSAVKTGTSKDMRDNWAIGYSKKYTIGVWVGNANGAPMWGVSGTSGAAPVWRDVMNFLYYMDNYVEKAEDWKAPEMPNGVIARNIHYSPALEAARQEFFLEGTEQQTITLKQEVETTNAYTQAKIIEPIEGVILALDPDIPPQNQRIRLSSTQNAVYWRLGESHIIGTGSSVNWLPLPGRHIISLCSLDGKVLDTVNIEVRGASLTRHQQ